MKRSVIFLDIDGVLNNNHTEERIGMICGIEDRSAALLAEVAKFLDADIVLISTWRMFWQDDGGFYFGLTNKEYRSYVENKLAKHGLGIADMTPDIVWAFRHMEIKKWLEAHPETERFVILDDEMLGYDRCGLGKHHVKTNAHTGLSRADVDEIKSDPARFDA